ncbi:hypothetical protein E4T56_gene5439 [Termitomyces sp. T112]|nr:hypothetical protein E4T56_gene5439 [Termitomyces sp. T112]
MPLPAPALLQTREVAAEMDLVKVAGVVEWLEPKNKKEAQWSLYLANFDFSLHHKPSWSMGKLDALFWRADHGMEREDNSNIVLLHPELFVIQAMEGLAVKEAEVDILWDMWWGNWDSQQEELVVHAAQMLKSGCTTGANSVHADEWALQDEILTFRDHIYMPNVLELHWRIVEQDHNSHIMEHPEHWKTLELVL